MFRTRVQNSSLFQEPKSPWLAHSIGDATQNIAKKKKKRTLLDKITSLQKYKQEGLKQTTFVCSSLKINEQVNELCEGKLEKKKNTTTTTTTKQRERKRESFGQTFSTPCTGRESNPGLPRGRREFYHWTTSAFRWCSICINNENCLISVQF